MFELSIALKYLIPRRRSLSTALISLLSVFVISLVVWLVVLFLSVTGGIEKNWLAKLTTLHAPVRITPTEHYYRSYYYQVDAIAARSHYTLKTIGEKNETASSDPYQVEVDRSPPLYWPSPDLLPSGALLDPVKGAYQVLEAMKEVSALSFQEYEISGALLRLAVARPSDGGISYLSQMSYLLSLEEENPRLRSLLLEPSAEELERLLALDPSLEEHLLQGPDGKPRARLDFDSPPLVSLPWGYFVQGVYRLPQQEGEVGILLPKHYKESGVSLGDPGALSYVAPAAASSQEQRIGVRVAGFYDPGILSVGNKCLLVPREVTRSIHAVNHTFSPDGTPSNGIFVWTSDLSQAETTAAEIREKFQAAGIAPYWKIDTYHEFEFSKDLLLQFQSDRTLFLLIGALILLVACSNIVSLLVLLVNDKKKEIAILLSMGASFRSIAAIFGFCGAIMGAVSSLFGLFLALFTLRHLDTLVSFLSKLQGHAAFNPAFFGQTLPNELSYPALQFVLIAVPLLSLGAGLIPALKASRLRPSAILRSE